MAKLVSRKVHALGQSISPSNDVTYVVTVMPEYSVCLRKKQLLDAIQISSPDATSLLPPLPAISVQFISKGSF